MQNIVITGGSDGMGKVTALHFLKKGVNVIVVGSTAAKGERFLAEAKTLGAGDRASFIQADLSSTAENQRVIEAVKSRFDHLDVLLFCAGKYQNQYVETGEGFEMVFATYYLSRYILSYGLKDLMEKADDPIIFNVAAPGMRGDVHWDDLNFRNKFNGLKASFHGSRLNDLSAVAFAENVKPTRIRYILYNPGFVGTDGVTKAFDNALKRLVVNIAVRIMGFSPEEGAAPIINLLENPPPTSLSAYSRQKPISLTMTTFNPANAQRLYQLTRDMLQGRLEPKTV